MHNVLPVTSLVMYLTDSHL